MDTFEDVRWWEHAKERQFESLFGSLKRIRDDDSGRRAANLRHMRLYGNRNVLGYGNTQDPTPVDRITLNVIKAATDTVSAKIAKNRPRPVFLTSGGNYSLRRKAKLLEKWVETQFYLSKVYKTSPRAVVDAAVFGLGAMKVFREGKEIKVERVFPGELYVDRADGLYGSPRSMIQTKFVSKEHLASLFPKYKDLIFASEVPSEFKDEFGYDKMANQCMVAEGWHLPSSPEAGDGSHCIAIGDVTLSSEEWTRDYFPFVFVPWTRSLDGFWGIGLAEELTGIQIEINTLLRVVQRSMRLISVPRVFLERGSKILSSKVTNDIGAVVEFSGSPPVFSTAQAMHPEVYAHIERLYVKGFELAGVGQDAVMGSIPSGLETGQAVREYRDLGSERFAVVSRDWEEAHLDIARMMVDLGREIHDEDPSYTVVLQRDKRTIAEVKWSDVDLRSEAYVLKVFPASSLPTSPAGRIAAVQELVGAGLIDQQTGTRLLDFPDLEDELSLFRASQDHIDNIIEKALDDNEFTPPEPFDDPVFAIKRVTAAYMRAKDDGVEEERLQHLRDFIQLTVELMQSAKAAQAAQAGPAQAPMPPAEPPTGA